MKLFGGINFASEANLLRHLGGALPQDGGRELVARFVHQGAGEVLAFARNDAFGKTGFDGSTISAGGSSESKELDAQVLTITTIGIGIEVPNKSTLDGRSCQRCPPTTASSAPSEKFSGRSKTISRMPRGLT